MTITVSILETGTIRIRPSHRTQTADRPVPLRRLRVLTDRRWTQPLPINTYLIELRGITTRLTPRLFPDMAALLQIRRRRPRRGP